ncbi:hypothetical protein EV567_5012 [Streptomyces sp. BK239]|nr:hypothetical protein EV567_5012 [Streptomyces sp. BK239]
MGPYPISPAPHRASNGSSRCITEAQEDSLIAAGLLQDPRGLHGYKYAIDTLGAPLALRVPATAILLTSDRDDWSDLYGKRVIIKNA